MNTLDITNPILNGYKDEKLTDERVNFLKTQANEQINEISKNQDTYNRFLKKVNAPSNIDNVILWILLMSNEAICCDYINEFNKDFEDIIPINDLADLLLYISYLNKIENIQLAGFNFLKSYKGEGIDEVDQYSFTNALLYLQKSKETTIEF